MVKKVIIIGGGQAGLQIIISLRQAGFDGTIELFSDEPYLPYQRPPLSKAYLSGAMERERLFLKPENFYEENNVTLHLGCRVETIDAPAQIIHHTGGESKYNVLVLATGSRPRPFPIAGGDNVFNLRGISDIDAMQGYFSAGKRLVIIGGGYIGLETAAVARMLGLEVVILEAAPRLLARVGEPEISAFYQHLHEAHGVKIITDCKIVGFEGNPVRAVKLESGEEVPADFIITGIGVLPNIALAQAAGLNCDNGIKTDEFGHTSDAAIYAAGDCTHHPNALLGREVRLESVPNAIEQAKAVAGHIANAATAKPYAEVPWFWSDQYDTKLQIAGFPERIDEKILRGDDKSNSFAWFYFTNNKLSQVISVNRAAEFLAGKQLIHKIASEDFSISHDKLTDESIRPKEWLT